MSINPPLASAADRDLSATPATRLRTLSRGLDLGHWDAKTWRNTLRLTSALVLLSFVICHLLAHCFLIVSFEAADAVFDVTMTAWQTKAGAALLLTAFLVHYGNALWSIYVRQSLRLPPWQWAQTALGLSIPLLITSHVMGTGVADNTLGVVGSYQSVLIAHWVAAPWHAMLQTVAVLTIWTHACIGIHFWLRPKPAYARWRPYLLVFALPSRSPATSPPATKWCERAGIRHLFPTCCARPTSLRKRGAKSSGGPNLGLPLIWRSSGLPSARASCACCACAIASCHG
jgi:succinate dehydrogenase/fumarate reductase cytochrome b subunit